MKVGVLVMFYNEAGAIPGLIDNLTAIGCPAKDVLFLDGRFNHFPGVSWASDDGSKDIITKAGCVYNNAPEGGDILQKTSYSFRLASALFDAVLRIDCDERIYGDWEQFCSVLKVIHEKTGERSFKVPFFDLDGYYELRSTKERVLVNFGRMECLYRHWITVEDGVRIRANYCTGGIHLMHDSTLRPKEREELMCEFQREYNHKIEFKGPLPPVKSTLKKMET